jgi:hypothetical protein
MAYNLNYTPATLGVAELKRNCVWGGGCEQKRLNTIALYICNSSHSCIEIVPSV